MDHGGMDMTGMGNMGSTPPPSSSSSPSTTSHRHGGMGMMMMHMSFYWGKDAIILFDRWPGTSTYKYVLALGAVFSVCILVEWLSRCKLVDPTKNEVVSGLVKMTMHGVRMGLAYVAMLAVMSFNVGVLIAAVAGHAVGFLVFGTKVLNGKRKDGTTSDSGGGHGLGHTHGGEKKPDLPPMSC